MKKRILSMILVIVMVLGVIPMTALAADEEACAHANTTESLVSNPDKTHSTVVTCDDCGEKIVQDTINIDFFEFAQAASEQDFWAGLKTVQTLRGHNVKVVNWTYNAEKTDEEKAARLAMIDWMATRDWRIDLSETDNRIYIADPVNVTEEAALRWAVGHNAYFMNMENRSDLKITFNAETAGLYDISVDVVKHSTSVGTSPIDTGVDVGGGYGDIYVNGQKVVEHYRFAADTNEDGSWAVHEQLVTIDLGEVSLNEGENTIAIRTTAHVSDGTGYGGRSWQFVNAINMNQVGSLTNCVDDNGDGKCDTCEAVIGECQHREAVAVSDGPNGDGTHTATFNCASCGQENITVTEKVDFKADLADAAQQSVWNGLADADLKNGGKVKYYGAAYNANYPEGATEAFNKFNNWLAENKGWSIDNSIVVNSSSDGQRVFFSPDDSALWGVSMNMYFTNFTDGRSDQVLNISAPADGVYDLTLDYVLSTSTATDFATLTSCDSGSGYVQVTVNGVVIEEKLSLIGAPAILSKTYEDVALNEGMNSVVIRLVANLWDSTTATGRNNINMAGYALSYDTLTTSCQNSLDTEIVSNGDETHSITAGCAVCGDDIIPTEADLNVIKVDFKEFAQEAAKQEFWASLPDEATAGGKAVKRIGVNYTIADDDLMSEPEEQAYADLIAWQQEELGWSFNEEHMQLCREDGNMIFISNDPTLKWGVLHHSYFYGMKNTDGRSDMALTVLADEAGYYQLDMNYAPQSSTAVDYPAYASIGAGGGYVDIYVNGELVVSNFNMKCSNYQEHLNYEANLATVYLEAGENDIVIYNLANYHGYPNSGYTGRGNTAIVDLTFSEVQTTLADAEALTVAVADVIGEQATATVDTLTVASSNGEVATAAISGTDIVITPAAEGQTVVSLTGTGVDGTALTAGQILVNVGASVTDACADADGDAKCDICGGDIACKHVYSVVQKIEAAEGEVHAVSYVCSLCDAVIVEAEMFPCQDTDEEFDGICNFCGDEVTCAHDKQVTVYEDNEDGTHQKMVGCDRCGEFILTETEDCYDEDADGACDACGAAVEAGCDHTNTTESVVDNGDKTHTITVTCECGEVISTETVDCADEDKDTKCDACGATLVTITKFAAAGSNMTLGNELVVNVMFMKNKITGTGNTIEITHGDAVTTVAQADWESYNAAMYVARIPVAAKEMADSLTVVVKNAEGYEISTAYTTSVREYAGKVLSGSLSTYSQLMKNLAVDMLNYGAAAQTNFSYNTEDMANKLLTEEQAGWATADVACTNNQVKGAKCMGSNLSLESKILLNIIFQLTDAAKVDKYAMVTYTDYTGKAVEYRVDEFNRFNASMQGIVIDEIVLADAFQLVTVTVYNADGTVYGTGSDSVESYAARTSNDLNAAIMKFASSAKTYLSK